MTEKRLTVILYGCDRNLWRGGPLQIRVSDLFASGGPRAVYAGKTEESTLELRLRCRSMPARCTASRSPPRTIGRRGSSSGGWTSSGFRRTSKATT